MLENKQKISRLSLRLFWVWIACTSLLVVVISVIGAAWSVRHVLTARENRFTDTQTRLVMTVAEFPSLARMAIKEFTYNFSQDPLRLLIDRRDAEQSVWTRNFPSPEDPGYLLLSGVDPLVKYSNVRLIRIADGVTVAKWNPDWSAIYKRISEKKFSSKGSSLEAEAVHPVLLANGDIIFNTWNSLVRVSMCNSELLWVLDEVMHHSNELDHNDDIWTNSVTQDGLSDNPWLANRVQDDALAKVSLDGKLIERQSFARILRDNGLQAMLLGTFGQNFNKDPIHLNQISVAGGNSRYWKKGDLLISAKNLSAVFLYRPSTRKILWYQQGPWMNQHSALFVDDHRISVFSNNVVSSVPKNHAFMSDDQINEVYVYDFRDDVVSQPFARLLAAARPRTITEGLSRLLPDGGLFLEETNYGRHLRFSKDGLMWSRINDYDDDRIGKVSWSRYLTAGEARHALSALATRECSAPKTSRPKF